MNKENIAEQLAEAVTASADMKSLLQCYYDDQLNYFLSLSDDELEHAKSFWLEELPDEM